MKKNLPKICENCKHYRRHYVKDRTSDHLLPIHYGHCVFPRCKPRDNDTPACKDFEALSEK